MQKTIEHLEEELLNIRAGKASPTVLNGVFEIITDLKPRFQAWQASRYPMPRPF